MRVFLLDEIEVPGGGHAEAVVAVVVPIVVDVQALGVEVAHVHAVAVRVHRKLLAPVYATGNREELF